MVKKFEAAIYNQQVRDAIKNCERHPDYYDEWADLHFIEVKADTVKEAREAVERRHPKAKGFVIDSIIALPEFE